MRRSTTTTTTTTTAIDQNSVEWLQAAAQLKAYVTAGEDSHRHLDENTILLDLTHSNLKQRHLEIRFDRHESIAKLRQIIHQKTGTPMDFQHLQIFNPNSQLMVQVPPNYQPSSQKLGYFSIGQRGWSVHCVDLNPHSISAGGQLEDTSLVQKYQMSDEDYAKRSNTLKAWEREQKLKDPGFTLQKHAQQHQALVQAKRLYQAGMPLPQGFVFDPNTRQVVVAAAATLSNEEDDFGVESVQAIQVGMRAEVQPGARRGTIQFVGPVPELEKKPKNQDVSKEKNVSSYWVGIVFDEPVGKSNGTIGTTRYFEAPDKHGGFCRGKNVTVGDFPERDIFDELDDSDDEDEL